MKKMKKKLEKKRKKQKNILEVKYKEIGLTFFVK